MATTDDRGGAIGTTRLDTADGEHERPHRVGRVLVGTAIVAVLVSGGGIAVAAGHDGSTTRVRTTSPPTLAPKPVVAKAHPKPTAARAKPMPTVAVTTVPRTPQMLVAVPPPASGPVRRTPTPPAPPPPPPPPAPTTAAPPKQYGASALTWDAPPSLAIAAGKTATLSVTAHNRTDGTVTLPHPLACTPRLDHGEFCTEVVQLIGSGQSASARYTIDARGTTKGHYTLKIEGVLTVSVTVS